MRAHALLKLKRPREALAAAAQATLAEPEDAEAFVALGLASVLVGMAGQALTAPHNRRDGANWSRSCY